MQTFNSFNELAAHEATKASPMSVFNTQISNHPLEKGVTPEATEYDLVKRRLMQCNNLLDLFATRLQDSPNATNELAKLQSRIVTELRQLSSDDGLAALNTRRQAYADNPTVVDCLTTQEQQIIADLETVKRKTMEIGVNHTW